MIEQLKVGDHVGIYRKSRLRYRGTLKRKVDANDDMEFGGRMGPEWILTIFVDGLGERRWEERRGGGMFTAKDLRKLGCVSIRKLD